MVSPSTVGLGRIPAPDPRDMPYRIEERRLPPRPVHRVTKHWPLFRKPLNQGSEGTCVGHGWRHWLEAAPVIQITGDEEPTARNLYIAALAIDEWAQNDWGDMQFGTSVRAGGKVLKDRGLISEYNMTDDVYTMADWLGGKDADGKFVGGPLVIGVDWDGPMFEPDPQGYIHPNGNPEGGHCVCLLGWDEKLGDFIGVNSWGQWGPKKGRFRMTAEEMHSLMKRGGEAWTAVEIRQ